jgi:uncharacterized protein involved in outer membrane biogenesis
MKDSSSSVGARLLAFPRRHPIWTGFIVALILLVVLFDWDWFRGPLERYISNKTHREFRISDLDVSLGMTPTIRMRDLYFANADWSKSKEPMAKAKEIEFSISLRDAFNGKILVPRISLTEPDLRFEQTKDDRRNWVLTQPNADSKSGSNFRIGSLSVNKGHVRYDDAKIPFSIDVDASTFDPTVEEKVKDAKAKPSNNRYTTRFDFKGNYRDGKFSGNALTGDTLSFQQTGIDFPLKGDLKAGTTHLQVEGTIADAAKISAIDVKLQIQGETLANLYPFLLLPLPASPPYELQGHLKLKGDKYTMDDLKGKIGSSDLQGSAGYVDRKPRPLLTADLQSQHLDITDLGPIVGVETKGSGGKPDTKQAETNTRAQAKKAQKKGARQGRILPSGTFDGSRLQKIDAEVKIDAKHLVVPIKLPLESLKGSLDLKDSVLKIDPLDIGFAGGKILAQIMLDARESTLKTDVKVDLRRIHIDQLVPAKSAIAKGAGLLGASVQLKGVGNSIADAAAKADGRIALAVSNGRISNLLDAASGLNGGKVLELLAGGDKDIPIRCGGVVFDVKNGKGKSDMFVIDTTQTQILGTGTFDLADERFDITVTPKPKHPGILSLRTPVRAYGTFRHPGYELKKMPLIARAAGAIALAAIAPIAALLPLIETGPGEQTDCSKVDAEVAGARKQATGKAAPQSAPKAASKSRK